MQDSVLMQRRASGFTVTLTWSQLLQTLVLKGETEQAARECVVDPAKALDAFEHPCCYLDAPEAFFARVTAQEEVQEQDNYSRRVQTEEDGA